MTKKKELLEKLRKLLIFISVTRMDVTLDYNGRFYEYNTMIMAAFEIFKILAFQNNDFCLDRPYPGEMVHAARIKYLF